VMCLRGKPSVYFNPGMAVDMVFPENGADVPFAALQVAGSSAKGTALDDAYETDLALRPTKSWLERLRASSARGDTVTVGFTPYSSPPATVSFRMAGLDAALAGPFAEACR
jgi:hypothetical protein